MILRACIQIRDILHRRMKYEKADETTKEEMRKETLEFWKQPRWEYDENHPKAHTIGYWKSLQADDLYNSNLGLDSELYQWLMSEENW